jgi:hypothetical protein
MKAELGQYGSGHGLFSTLSCQLTEKTQRNNKHQTEDSQENLKPSKQKTKP